MPWTPTCRRAAFIIVNIARMPLFGSPTRYPVEFSKSMTQVAEPLIPILCSSEVQTTPLGTSRPPSGRSLGTRNMLIPLMPGGASGVRASTRWRMFSVRSWSPAEMKILLPVTL